MVAELVIGCCRASARATPSEASEQGFHARLAGGGQPGARERATEAGGDRNGGQCLVCRQAALLFPSKEKEAAYGARRAGVVLGQAKCERRDVVA